MRTSTKPKIALTPAITPDDEMRDDGVDGLHFHHTKASNKRHPQKLSRAVQSFPVRMGDHAVMADHNPRFFGSSIVGDEAVGDDEDYESPSDSLHPTRQQFYVKNIKKLFLFAYAKFFFWAFICHNNIIVITISLKRNVISSLNMHKHISNCLLLL